jgi:nucleoside-diphosphate-sugar epimerase
MTTIETYHKKGCNISVLVTGSTGFIGTHLTSRLISLGYKIKVLARDKSKLDSEIFKNVSVVEGDLLDINALKKAVYGVDIIFNLAGNANSWDTWSNYYDSNVAGIETLINSILDVNHNLKRIIHFSTVDVYGYAGKECSEDDDIGGKYGYGKSKFLGEKLLKESCLKNDIPFTIVRPTNVMGPNSQYIKGVGGQIKAGLMLAVKGGKVDAGFICVENLIDYVLWIAESEIAINEIYNLCDNNNKTWNEYFYILKKQINSKAILLKLPYRLAFIAALVFEFYSKVFNKKNEPLLHRFIVDMFGNTCNHSAEKIRKHSKIQPCVKFDDAIQKSIDWFIEDSSHSTNH